jgi:hypothetical protein
MSVHEEQSSRRLLVFFLGRHLEEMDKYGCGVDQGYWRWRGTGKTTSTAFNASREEGHQRKAKAMSTPDGEDNEALMRESDEEKRWRHQKDPHVGSSGKIERHRCARRSHMRQAHMSFSLHGSLTKRREKEPRAARSQAHMSTSIVSSQIEWLTRWTRRRSYGEEKNVMWCMEF